MHKPVDIALELDADERLAARFNLRVRALFGALWVVYATLVVVYAFSGTSLYFTSINCLMLIVAGLLLFGTRDIIVYFLASHPAWAFSFTTYVFAAANLKPIEEGLFDAAQSITIAFVYQLSCVAAFFLSLRVLRRQRQSITGARTIIALQRFSEVFIVFGALATALGVVIADPTVSAITQDLQIFLWLGLALHLQKNRGFRLDAPGIFIICLFAALAVYANNRTVMMSWILVLGLGYLYYSSRLFSLPTVILGYFAINFMILFSSVSLDIRMSGGRESGHSMVSLYSEKLLTSETLVALVNPFYTHSSAVNVRNMGDDSYGHDFWLPYFGSSNSLGDRFVILPLMDVVCGQFGEANRVRWDDLRNLVTASLPNFGQTKNLEYNDQLTWDLGLRDDGVVGKPMLTNACELYTMAGWTGMFLVGTIEFFLIFYYIAVTRRQLEFHIIYLETLAISVMMLTFTTSSLGVAANVVRGFPIALILIWITKQLSFLALPSKAASAQLRST